MSEQIGPADGLSVTMLAHLKKTLGEPYASRFVTAEKLVVDFRSHRVAAEIVAFGEAAGIAIQLTERALSNEVITPGKTTLEDVAWWMQDRLLDRALGSEFDMPSVYVTGPAGIVATSSNRIIQPGDVMMIDWGVQLMNFGTDVKRVAYVLKPGETAPPKSIQAAFDKAISVRDVVKKAIKVGVRADETMKRMDAALQAAGFGVIEFNRPNKDDKTDVTYGFHPVGNTGHDIGPSLTTWQPFQSTFVMHAQHMFSFEYFAYTPIAEWGGAKLRIPIEDDAILTDGGHPVPAPGQLPAAGDQVGPQDRPEKTGRIHMLFKFSVFEFESDSGELRKNGRVRGPRAAARQGPRPAAGASRRGGPPRGTARRRVGRRHARRLRPRPGLLPLADSLCAWRQRRQPALRPDAAEEGLQVHRAGR